MRKKIHIVDCTNFQDFRREVNRLHENGWKIFNISTVPPARWSNLDGSQRNPYYSAVMTKRLWPWQKNPYL